VLQILKRFLLHTSLCPPLQVDIYLRKDLVSLSICHLFVSFFRTSYCCIFHFYVSLFLNARDSYYSVTRQIHEILIIL
ncbi:hypothetical protein GIB67_035317, partial [Kingdonia uniflora]